MTLAAYFSDCEGRAYCPGCIATFTCSINESSASLPRLTVWRLNGSRYFKNGCEISLTQSTVTGNDCCTLNISESLCSTFNASNEGSKVINETSICRNSVLRGRTSEMIDGIEVQCLCRDNNGVHADVVMNHETIHIAGIQ